MFADSKEYSDYFGEETKILSVTGSWPKNVAIWVYTRFAELQSAPFRKVPTIHYARLLTTMVHCWINTPMALATIR